MVAHNIPLQFVFQEPPALEGSFPFGIPFSPIAPNFHHYLGNSENEEGHFEVNPGSSCPHYIHDNLIISIISLDSCTEDISVRTPNLKKLEIRGEQFSRDLLGKKAPVVEEGNMVGFDKDAETLVERFKGGMSEIEIVSIIGMGDQGKTTLVQKVFTDPTIQYEFNIRAWIYVFQDYSGKEVLNCILSSVEKFIDEMHKWRDERLAEEMRLHLQTKR
ncbi:hypothetical protein U1Q18_001977 [Sarracenia purpurea var. burkii]